VGRALEPHKSPGARRQTRHAGETDTGLIHRQAPSCLPASSIEGITPQSIKEWQLGANVETRGGLVNRNIASQARIRQPFSPVARQLQRFRAALSGELHERGAERWRWKRWAVSGSPRTCWIKNSPSSNIKASTDRSRPCSTSRYSSRASSPRQRIWVGPVSGIWTTCVANSWSVSFHNRRLNRPEPVRSATYRQKNRGRGIVSSGRARTASRSQALGPRAVLSQEFAVQQM
jgi:hypothetical protein